MVEGITPSFFLNMLKFLEGIIPYFFPPQIEVVKPGSYFGRLNSENGPFALFLKLRLRNESERATLIRSIHVQHAGKCSEPIQGHPDRLFTEHGWVVDFPRREENILITPRITPMDVVERFALFVLTEPAETWPKILEFTVKVKFVRRRIRKIPFTFTDRG
jgi:hypothetical protein